MMTKGQHILEERLCEENNIVGPLTHHSTKTKGSHQADGSAASLWHRRWSWVSAGGCADHQWLSDRFPRPTIPPHLPAYCRPLQKPPDIVDESRHLCFDRDVDLAKIN